MESEKQIDILIIGGGPTACAAGLYALTKNLKIVLISPERILPKAIQSLYPDIIKLLDLIDCKEVLEMSRCGRYTTVSINGQRKELVEYENIPDIGYHIVRENFDKYLIDKVRGSGGEIIHSRAKEFVRDSRGNICGVNTYDGQALQARHVIDASGVMRFSGKQLSLEEEFYSPEFIVTTGQVLKNDYFCEDHIFEFYTQKDSCWYWIIGHHDKLTWTKLNLKGQHELKPPEKLSKLSCIGKVTAQNMTWRKYKKLTLPGLLIAGDAAAVIDPASGQGIHSALLSGIKAVQAIISNNNSPTHPLVEYEAWYSAYFEAKCSELAAYYKHLGLTGLLV